MAIDQFGGQHAVLSNFFTCSVQMGDITFPSSEHAFQAAKSSSRADWEAIARLPDPGQAKQYGRTVQLRADWDKVRKRVMLNVLMAKFGRHPSLAAVLSATGQELLVEGNYWHDNYWGDCRCLRRASCAEPGLNYLGKLLMAVRDILRED
jgi:hypothetical protein